MARLEGIMLLIIVSGMGLGFMLVFSINPAVNHTTVATSTQSASSIPPTTTMATTTAGSASTTTSLGLGYGKLSATFAVGPTQPVCYASTGEDPAPSYFSSIKAVVTDPQGHSTAYAINWISNGCYVTGLFSTLLPTGDYSLNLSSCNWMGCKSALPKDFVVQKGTTADVEVSIFTGIV